MYNKKVLSNAMKSLASRKAPAKKKDKVVTNNKLLPFISSEGYKQGPPPAGTHYRIPSDTIYNPTDYAINAVGSNGEERFIAPGDTRNHTFEGAEYVDEFPVIAQKGKIIYVDDPNDPRIKLSEDEEFIRNIEAQVLKKLKSAKTYNDYEAYKAQLPVEKIKDAYSRLEKYYKGKVPYGTPVKKEWDTDSENVYSSTSEMIRPLSVTPIYKYQDPIRFTPPEITDLDFAPVEPEKQWTNPNPEDDVEQRTQGIKVTIPEMTKDIS